MEKQKNTAKTNGGKNAARSTMQEIWHQYKKNRGAMLGLVVVILIVLVAIAAQFIYDYDTDITALNFSARFARPGTAGHPLGADQFGRDVLARMLYGAKFSLSVGILSVMVSLLVGTSLGLVAGFYGGWVETLIMRVCDVFASIPSMLLAICIATALGQSVGVLMLAVGIVSVPSFARVARASVMTVRDQEYIEAAKASGARDIHLMVKHILPNALAPIVVQATMRVASAIIVASSLSFLGLGVPLPAPEWGGMLSDGREFIRDYNYLTMFPGIAIMITVLAINLIGDGLRDAMDPKLKR